MKIDILNAVTPLGFAIVALAILSGCMLGGRDLVRDGTVTVEPVSPQYAKASQFYVQQAGPDLVIYGKLRRYGHERGKVPDHVDVEIVDPKGVILKRVSTEYRRVGKISGRHRRYRFAVRIPIMPPPGTIIRVIQHDNDNDMTGSREG